MVIMHAKRYLTGVSSALDTVLTRAGRSLAAAGSGLSAMLELGLGLWVWQGEELLTRATGPLRALARWWHGTRAAAALRKCKARLARWLEQSRAGRVLLTLREFCARHTPRWLYPVLVACAFIPGPVDEGLVIIVMAVVLLGSRPRRRELAALLRSAWPLIAHRWPFQPDQRGMLTHTVTLRGRNGWAHVHLSAADADDALARAVEEWPGAVTLRVQPHVQRKSAVPVR